MMEYSTSKCMEICAKSFKTNKLTRGEKECANNCKDKYLKTVRRCSDQFTRITKANLDGFE